MRNVPPLWRDYALAVIFARRIFLIAGIYGLIVLTPMYFLESRTGRDSPPAITHPEYYYGFIGVALAWQVVFILISRDPARYRLMMIPSILEKATFAVAVVVLFQLGRTGRTMLAAGLIDAMWGILFIVAFLRGRRGSIDPNPGPS